MKYEFESKVKATDFWKASMYRTYHSLIGVCNAVFSVAVILLTLRFWNQANGVVKILLVLACLLFPVFQPLAIIMRAQKQVNTLPENLIIGFDDAGIHVSTDGQHSDVAWDQVRGVAKEQGLVMLMLSAARGYVFTDRILGTEKDAFLTYVEQMVNKSRKG
ncbi:MAG: YcxB family protein [Lachnospiraceae bacterium]|nr:YcxB family protein [Lachnospiraceae bacterium]